MTGDERTDELGALFESVTGETAVVERQQRGTTSRVIDETSDSHVDEPSTRNTDDEADRRAGEASGRRTDGTSGRHAVDSVEYHGFGDVIDDPKPS